MYTGTRIQIPSRLTDIRKYKKLLFCILITVVGMLLTKPLLRLTNVPSELMTDASTYMLICIGTLIAVTAIPFIGMWGLASGLQMVWRGC